MAEVVVVAAGILSGCGRARELELVSTDGGAKTVLRRDDIARVTRVQAKDELYELGVCGAEIAWAGRDVAAIFVKNCLGRSTFVAYDFRQRRLARGPRMDDAYRGRKVGNGRLLGDP